MRIVFTISIIFLSLKVNSQKIDTTYYDKDWQSVQSRAVASFYGTKQKINDSTVLIKDYYMTDTLQNKGQYINGIKNGRWTYFYPNGKVKIDFEYTRNGTSKHWYVFNEEELKPNQQGIYHTFNNWPTFEGSPKTPNDYINKNFDLPQRAIKKGFTSFEVTIRVVIDEKGKIISANEEKTVGYWDKDGKFKSREEKSKLKYGVEKALVDFLLNMPNWRPVTVRGEPVKSSQNLHIKYGM